MALTSSGGFPYCISLVEGQDYRSLINASPNLKLLENISEDKSTYRYENGKWSIRQIVGHMTDHERIMVYRALRFSRNDDTKLSGYDQEFLTTNANFDHVPYHSLLEDFRNVRNSTISFMKTLAESQLKLKGFAWKFELSVEDVLKATIGHELHHVRILSERYGL